MQAALALAREAFTHGDVPVGAVVLDPSGKVIGRGCNRRQIDGDPLAHAEVIALMEATRHQAARHRAVQNSTAGSPQTGLNESNVQTKADTDAESAWNLEGCTLVVSLEPCPMCAGAAVQTHVDRIVFGAWDAKLGACGSVWDIPRDPHSGHHAQVTGGVLRDESEALLRKFFAARRQKSVSLEH